MNNRIKRRMIVGIGGFMFPVPRYFSQKGLAKGVSSAKEKTTLLSDQEQCVHYYIVEQMVVAREPIRAKSVSTALGIPVEKIVQMIDKLEDLKTFLFRSDGKTVDWAYPLSLQNTGHELRSLKGERFFAA
ncbi:MAG: hypothetical protein JRE14_11085 [Deltaproteobacteria bacterium]|nr:hypothetical protein [Deltaproteobacteria bacterium]MBW2634645.1 hypothetical protein [Deltaproteobacteria bacterium]